MVKGIMRGRLYLKIWAIFLFLYLLCILCILLIDGVLGLTLSRSFESIISPFKVKYGAEVITLVILFTLWIADDILNYVRNKRLSKLKR